ncbi:hypothetical protein EXU85_23330 [Spirosoma sp. KCTC 42546]|uniref:hypothetical protein n=1 Tax=Spirosoma sp. KCTC 42546 TaxID=2520506 RepID=UPI00115B90D2|nr:hypothetical protein [Spirosoma sp. KCTC 42546]QDK81381.1 hypothetical protein EXU85_23330 [Spirosoma sp. KCTC 42546]
MSRLTLILIACVGLYNCNTPDVDPFFDAASVRQAVPIERVSRMTVKYTSTLESKNYVGKDTVNGQIYSFIGTDEYSFQYDAQNRLIKQVLVQTSASDNGLHSRKDQYSYSYANGRMTETQTTDGGTRTYSFTLDSAQVRVLAYTKRSYTDTGTPVPATLDTLRQYSPEGILKQVVRGANRQMTTIDKKNITKIDEYSNRTGKLDNSTSFDYDMDHNAPPAYFTFLGETSRNAVVKRTTQYGTQDQANAYTSTYQNTYDAQDRLIKQVEYSQYPGQDKPIVATITTYSY